MPNLVIFQVESLISPELRRSIPRRPLQHSKPEAAAAAVPVAKVVSVGSRKQDDANVAAGARLEVRAEGLGSAAEAGQHPPEVQDAAGLLPVRRRGQGVRARRGELLRADILRPGRAGGQSLGHVRELSGRTRRHRGSTLAPHRWLIFDTRR